MARRIRPLLAAAGVVLAAALVGLPAWAVAHRPDPGSLYTVTQVVDGTLRHPKEWEGRTVRVQANASVSLQTVFRSGAQGARSTPQILLFPPPDPRHPSLLQDGTIRVLIGREDGVLALLRRVPLIGGAASAPQRVSLTHPGTYRIRVQSATEGCNFSPCITALLVDAASVKDPTAGLPYGS